MWQSRSGKTISFSPLQQQHLLGVQVSYGHTSALSLPPLLFRPPLPCVCQSKRNFILLFWHETEAPPHYLKSLLQSWNFSKILISHYRKVLIHFSLSNFESTSKSIHPFSSLSTPQGLPSFILLKIHFGRPFQLFLLTGKWPPTTSCFEKCTAWIYVQMASCNVYTNCHWSQNHVMKTGRQLLQNTL